MMNMPMMSDAERLEKIKEYIEARDVALNGTLEQFVAFALANKDQGNIPAGFYGPVDPVWAPFTDKWAAEQCYHKMRTASMRVPEHLRARSHNWLVARGLRSYLGPGVKEV